MSDWTEVKISVPSSEVEKAGDIATMIFPGGIYIEDYRDLEKQAMEVAHIDLIDEELLSKDRSRALVHVYVSPEENPAESVAFLSERLSAEKIDFEIDLSSCRNEDWENNWKSYFHSMPIGDKLFIHPVWEDEYDSGGRTVIDIEPGLAFGSGSHETTKLCLEALERYVTPQTTVLDIGCGSGILSVAALLLGAQSAVGVDIDALAVKTAAENGEKNGFVPPEYTVIQGDLAEKVSGKFDVIVANIIADVIIAFCPKVGDFLAPGGVFITSGIIDSRKDEILEAFEKNGFHIKESRNENGWMCFECSK